MEGTRQGRLLVVDFDFFFHNPFEGLPAAHRGDPMLYDWAHSEAVPFLQDGIWTFRAEDFYRAGITPPRCEQLDGFWDRFTFTTASPQLFYADSNLHAGRLTPAHYSLLEPGPTAWREVHLFDAHHDSGYPHRHGPATFEEWRERGEYSCEDWMLLHHANGSRLLHTYPTWRPHGDSHPPMVPLETHIDDHGPVAAPFDAVFLCRSGAWVPSWCDDQFTQLLNAFPGHAQPFPGADWSHPRPDPLPQARHHAALFAGLTAHLPAPPAPTAPAAVPPGPAPRTLDMNSSPEPDATHGLPRPEEAAAADQAAVRKERARELITRAAPAQAEGEEHTLSYEEFRARCEDPEALQEALRRIAEVERASHQRLRQNAAALEASLPHGPEAAAPARRAEPTHHDTLPDGSRSPRL
ncbi:hypothetical protein [Streptomyces sp. PT19]|uniref:hypothetical protein n=1 Tax=Streptomyces sp. PT19 TaxID=3452239 RepID=UPI003F7EC1BA